MHELFRTLSGSDDSDSKEPLPPSNFLSAVGKLNPMFEGNQQQDAHEMLGYILNLLQEIKIQAAPAAPLTGKLVFLILLKLLTKIHSE